MENCVNDLVDELAMLEDVSGGMATLTLMSDGSALVVFDVEDEDEDFVAEGETPEDALDEAFAIVGEFFDGGFDDDLWSDVNDDDEDFEEAEYCDECAAKILSRH